MSDILKNNDPELQYPIRYAPLVDIWENVSLCDNCDIETPDCLLYPWKDDRICKNCLPEDIQKKVT